MNFFRRYQKLESRVRELEMALRHVNDVLCAHRGDLERHRVRDKEMGVRHVRLLDHLGLAEVDTPARTQLVKKGGPERSDG